MPGRTSLKARQPWDKPLHSLVVIKTRKKRNINKRALRFSFPGTRVWKCELFPYDFLPTAVEFQIRLQVLVSSLGLSARSCVSMWLSETNCSPSGNVRDQNTVVTLLPSRQRQTGVASANRHGPDRNVSFRRNAPRWPWLSPEMFVRCLAQEFGSRVVKSETLLVSRGLERRAT